MPDERMRELCLKISAEKDSKKLMELTEELIKLLSEEQDTIRMKIRETIGKSVASAE
jgi:hypothetical protein